MNISKKYKHKDFLDLLLNGKRADSSLMVAGFLKNNPAIKDLYENILKESLYEIGEMWECGKISVATEHLASAIVEAILNELYDRVISNNRNNKTMVAACVENELHQIGIKMVADVFEMNGWDAHFIGANIPTNELIEFIKEINPDVLALSLSIYFHLPTLEFMIEKISRKFPDIIIIVRGQAFRYGGKDVLLKYPKVHYIDNLYSVESFIKGFDHNG